MDRADAFIVQDSTSPTPVGAAHALHELQAALMQASRTSAVETMAITLAHELNQPLTAIANYIETVRDLLGRPDYDPANLQKALGEAAQQSLRAGDAWFHRKG